MKVTFSFQFFNIFNVPSNALLSEYKINCEIRQ